MLQRLLKDNPIVITGVGAITAAGPSADALWQRVCASLSPAVWLPFPRRAGAKPFAGCVATLPPERPPAWARKLDRSARLALVAAQEAWQHAQLNTRPATPERVGIVAATSRGTVEKWEHAFAQLAQEHCAPSLIANTTIANLSGALSLRLQAKGPALTLSATCASGAAAIALGAQQLVLGEADVVVAGGAEAPLRPVVLEQFAAARLLGSHSEAAKTCRPFDLTRDGVVLGEGAGFLVLETLASAQRRGVSALARLSGWALGADAHHRAGMSTSGGDLARLIRQSLTMAGLPPEAIGYLNLHGTGTPMNDLGEARAIAQVFGTGPRRPACSSTKPITGHCMGAGAAVEAIVCLAALREQRLPPSANCEQPDPECAIDLVRGAPRSAPFRAALSTSAGFWGNQAALVFEAI